MKVSRPPSTPTQDIYPQKNLGRNLLVEKFLFTRNSDSMIEHTSHFCAISAIHLNHCKFIAKSQTHPSHVWYQITQELDLKYPPAPLACCWFPAWKKWWKILNTFWFYRTNETWQTYQRFYPNAWLVEDVVWKCCRRRLIYQKHLILTRSLWFNFLSLNCFLLEIILFFFNVLWTSCKVRIGKQKDGYDNNVEVLISPRWFPSL